MFFCIWEAENNFSYLFSTLTNADPSGHSFLCFPRSIYFYLQCVNYAQSLSALSLLSIGLAQCLGASYLCEGKRSDSVLPPALDDVKVRDRLV